MLQSEIMMFLFLYWKISVCWDCLTGLTLQNIVELHQIYQELEAVAEDEDEDDGREGGGNVYYSRLLEYWNKM